MNFLKNIRHKKHPDVPCMSGCFLGEDKYSFIFGGIKEGVRDVYLKYGLFFPKYTYISTIVFRRFLLYTIKIRRVLKKPAEYY